MYFLQEIALEILAERISMERYFIIEMFSIVGECLYLLDNVHRYASCPVMLRDSTYSVLITI